MTNAQQAGETTRRFEEADEGATVAVWHRAGRTVYSFLPAWQVLTLESATEIFRTAIRPRCDLWVGTTDHRVVAFLALKGSYIDRLYVDPAVWQHGWGTRLVGLAKRLSPDGLELHTHQANLRARRFWERQGFVATRFGTSPPPEGVPDVEYVWRPDRTDP